MDTGTDTTVYLPGDLKARAKAAGLNLSGMLREAVTEELDRLEALEAARDGMVVQRVQTSEDRYGENPVVLRFTGKALASDGGTTVWLLEDGRVLLEGESGYIQFADAQEYGDWVHDWEARDNMGAETEAALRNGVYALGIVPVVDL